MAAINPEHVVYNYLLCGGNQTRWDAVAAAIADDDVDLLATIEGGGGGGNPLEITDDTHFLILEAANESTIDAPDGDLTISSGGELQLSISQNTIQMETGFGINIDFQDDLRISGVGSGDRIFVGQGGESLSFYGATPVAQQTGVAVDAAGIHAALVALGLITA